VLLVGSLVRWVNLQALDSDTVFEASKNVPSALTGDLTWGPVVDGVEILDDPRTLAAQGKFNKVPVLLGTNMDEGTLFLKASHDINVTGMYDFVAMMFGEELAPEVMAHVRSAPFLFDCFHITCVVCVADGAAVCAYCRHVHAC